MIGQWPGGRLDLLSEAGPQTLSEEDANPYEEQIASFAEAARAGQEPLTSGEEGRKDLAIGFALRQSAKEKRMVAPAEFLED